MAVAMVVIQLLPRCSLVLIWWVTDECFAFQNREHILFTPILSAVFAASLRYQSFAGQSIPVGSWGHRVVLGGDSVNGVGLFMTDELQRKPIGNVEIKYSLIS